MDMNTFNPQSGMDVIGSDGEKVGEVDAVEQDYLIVRKGFFFPQDHYIPFSAVDSADENSVYLNVTKDGALEQQWGERPGTMSDTGYADDGLNANVSNSTYGETDMTDRGFDDTGAVNTGYADTQRDHDTIEVREEDLTATKREVDRGAVRVDTNVVEEQRTIDVPVTEEDVHIHHRAVDRPVDNVGADFQETTFEVPLKGEEVEVSKTARVVEEIDIDKTAHQRTERVSDTVRREEVDISGDGVHTDRDDMHENTGGRNDQGLLDKAKDAMSDDKNR